MAHAVSVIVRFIGKREWYCAAALRAARGEALLAPVRRSVPALAAVASLATPVARQRALGCVPIMHCKGTGTQHNTPIIYN